MARPRKFDEQQVLKRALQAFWEKGYEATTYDDLVRITGLGRGSLMAAFGDKESLFLRVLDFYIAGRTQLLRSQSEPDERGSREILQTLLLEWVGLAAASSGASSGCFLMLSGVAGDAPAPARDKLLLSLNQIRAFIAELIERGQKSGEIAAQGDPQQLAAFCVTLMQGIALTARAGWGERELRASATEALSHIFGPASLPA